MLYRLADRTPEIDALAWLAPSADVIGTVRLAAGANDPMVTAADMRPLDAEAELFPGAGHNLHVERPAELWRLLRRVAG